MYLTLEEFQAIDFKHKEGEQFAIVYNILHLLTGIKFTNQPDKTASKKKEGEK